MLKQTKANIANKANIENEPFSTCSWIHSKNALFSATVFVHECMPRVARYAVPSDVRI